MKVNARPERLPGPPAKRVIWPIPLLISLEAFSRENLPSSRSSDAGMEPSCATFSSMLILLTKSLTLFSRASITIEIPIERTSFTL